MWSIVTAYADYLTSRDPSIVGRHKLYVSALESTGVETVLGNFKRKPRNCRSCNAMWDSHEEKETDVNIAVRLVADAYKDKYDVAYVLSSSPSFLRMWLSMRLYARTNRAFRFFE